MKRIASSRDTGHMAGLRQYMLRRGIAVSVSEQAGNLEMWVIEPRDYDAAAMLLSEYQANPPQTQPAQHQPGLLQPTLKLLATQAGIVTFIIAVAVVLVAGAQFLWSMERTLAALMITPPNSTGLAWQQPWRFLSPALLHMSATHLFFNLFWWWYLGGRIELALGGKTLLLLFVVTGISANVLQWYTSGPLFGGLSGVVYGLLGFCAVYGWRRRSALNLPPALLVFMIGWLLLGYTSVLWVNMANEAHLMGLISGALLGVGFRFTRRPQAL